MRCLAAKAADGYVLVNVDDEPAITEWTETTYADVLTLLAASPRHVGIVLIGVDGRSGSGKSTFAARLARTRARVAVVHTDDIAWHHSFFDWDELLIEGILSPLRSGGPPLVYRPPAWDARDRPGFVEIPADTEVVIVEGVGACRKALEPWYDATVWVQSDAELAYRRVVARGDDPIEFVDEWTAQEVPFLANDRPWARATLIASGEASSIGGGRVLTARRSP